jgi:hypothetical protein
MSTYNNINVKGYIQIHDITSPENPENGQGRLYKKTGSDSIFWKPDSSGLETNIINSFDQSLNTTNNVEFKEVKVDLVELPNDWKIGGNFDFNITNGLNKPLSISNQVVNTEKDNTRISLGDNIAIQNSAEGTLDFNRYNGTLDNQTDVLVSNDIGGINFNGLVNGTYQTGAYIKCRTNDNWVDGGGKGAIINFASTISNQNTPVIQMSINGQGVYINDGTDKFLLPQNDGAIGRVMTMGNNSIAEWIEPFSSDQPTDIGTTPQFNEINYPNWKTSIDAGNRFEFLYAPLTAKLNIEPSGNLVSFGQEDCVNYLKAFRGTIGAESESIIGDKVGFCFDAQSPLGSRTIGCIIANTLTTLTSTNHHSDMTFSITKENEVLPTTHFRIKDTGLVVGNTNDYTLPITRGTDGQILKINGTGDVSWQTTNSIEKDETAEQTMVGSLIINGTLSLGASGSEFVFPTTRGLEGQILQSGSTGLLSWVNPSSYSQYVSMESEKKVDTTAPAFLVSSSDEGLGSLSWSSSAGSLKTFNMGGLITHTASSVLNLKLFYGATEKLDWAITFDTTPKTDINYRVDIKMLTKNGNNHTFLCSMIIGTVQTASMNYNTTTTLDTSAENPHSLRADWTSSSNSISQTFFSITSKTPPS